MAIGIILRVLHTLEQGQRPAQARRPRNTLSIHKLEQT